jgi:hypothetical protein
MRTRMQCRTYTCVHAYYLRTRTYTYAYVYMYTCCMRTQRYMCMHLVLQQMRTNYACQAPLSY